ncbi:MAG TPA: DUF2953 domain-containing protein [Vicinamibacterales bacterium]|nr:DUF2953 domain-containing protein [Vicinamibacterales bacterium]
MIRICRSSIAVLLAAVLVAPTTLAAAENAAAPARPSTALTYNGQPLTSVRPVTPTPLLLEQRETVAPSNALGQFGYGRRRHRNDAAMTAMLLGAAGAIAGTAVLVYANRPDCSVNANFNGCGYGTKVVGASLLSAGLVGVLIGAVTWR